MDGNTLTVEVHAFSKWPNDRMVAVVKHCEFLAQEDEAAEKVD